MSYGTLYGVGVGPGAPDLLTLRAVDILRRAPVLALPRGSDFGASMAWRIIKPIIGEQAHQERLFLTFPMVKDPARLRPAWDRAFDEIGARLERGLDVAFAVEGDPSLYSSFIYLQREAQDRWPGIRVEVVPAVSSILAVPAVLGVPLADGLERIAILPGNYGVEDLPDILRRFDTVLLMKTGSELPRILELLEEEGLGDKAAYVSRATMEDQVVIRDLRQAQGASGDCFSMVMVARKTRSGALAGDVPQCPYPEGAARG